MQFGDVKFFTDITITLAWIQSPSRNFKPFVSSRVGEIQSNPDLSQWMYIPSEDNVADDLSQGIHVNALNERWINGPALLRLQKSVWPNQMTSLPTPDEDMERRQIVVTVSTVKAKDIIDPSTFSSWRKLIRVTARIRWLAEKIRLRRNAQEGKKGPLKPEELQGAETFWIKQAQETLHGRLE